MRVNNFIKNFSTDINREINCIVLLNKENAVETRNILKEIGFIDVELERFEIPYEQKYNIIVPINEHNNYTYKLIVNNMKVQGMKI